MAVKPVSLTYIGDASEALKWVGFAKKKARQLGEWCAATGMPTGQNYLSPVPDVSIRVWYTNGLLNARIEASGKPFGFAFKRHDKYASTIIPRWWDIARTRDNVFVDVSKGIIARGAGAYKLGQSGLIRYGSWPCQERENGELITVAEYKLDPGRTFPTFPAPNFSYSGRKDVRMDTAYPLGDPETFFFKGRSYKTVDDCYGAFMYQGELFTLEMFGSYTHSTAEEFNTGAVIRLVKVSGGMSNANTPASRTVLDTQDVGGLRLIPDAHSTGLFSVAPDGSAGVAKYDGVSGSIMYVRMSGTGESITGVLSLVTVNEDPTPTAPDGTYTLPAIQYERQYDFIAYQGGYVPVRVHTELVSATQVPFVGITAVLRFDMVVTADLDYSGTYATELIRKDITTPGMIWDDYNNGQLGTPIVSNVSLHRGIVATQTLGLYKLDADLGTATLLDAPMISRFAVHARKDYICAVVDGFRAILTPVYTDGVLTGYTATTLENVNGMANALGDGYLATDAYGHYGLLGTI